MKKVNNTNLPSIYSSTVVQPTIKREETEFYLINKDYMDKIKAILCFNNVEDNLRKNTHLNNAHKIIDNLNNIDMLQIQNLLKESFNALNSINQNTIDNKLNDGKLYKIPIKDYNSNMGTKIFYPFNCQIINKEIMGIIKEIDIKKNQNLEFFKCHYRDNKIIAILNNQMLNIGSYDNHFNFIAEYIIYSTADCINIIYNTNIQKGLNSIMNTITNDLIQFDSAAPNNRGYWIRVTARIEKIIERKNTTFEISDKFKAFILLSIYREKNRYNPSNVSVKKTFEPFYLISKNWLDQYEYEEIYNLIKFNNNIINEKSAIINSNSFFLESIKNSIINKLDKQSTIKIEQKLQKKKNITAPIKPEYDTIKLKDNKQIIIYKNFILINQQMMNVFHKTFKDKFSIINNIFYLNLENKDIISINNQAQNTIFIGNINNENYSFNINYILDFLTYETLKSEANILANCGISNYIASKTVFNGNQNEYFSPIFTNNDVIGFGYINVPNINYNLYTKYYDLMADKKFLNIKNLYSSEQQILKMSNGNYSPKKNFYLINKKVLDQIKSEYNYKEFCDIMGSKKNIPSMRNQKKEFYSFIKTLPEDFLVKYQNNKNIKTNYSKEELTPLVINKKYIDKSEKKILIYNNFELLTEGIIELFINDINKINLCKLECEIIWGKIIINYLNKLNSQYVSSIGIINNENTYITEYLLIYRDYKSYYNDMYYISQKLMDYIDETQLINGIRPIIDENYKEVGTIVKIDNQDEYYFPPPPDDKKNITNINDYFNFPPLIGLENIGATCYMNATLQCFCNIKKFVNFFKYNKHVIKLYEEEKNKLSSSFKLLIERLWPNNYDDPKLKKFYAPNEFKRKISTMNPLFKGVAANDAKDLVNFIIMTLHEELNKAKNSSIVNNNITLDQTNQQIMFQNFANNFMKQNQSIISDLFYGINCNKTKCGNCGKETYNFQTYFFIVFPLEEVRKFKLTNNNISNMQFNNFNFNFMNNNNNSNVVTIYDCFDYDRKVNVLSGDNSMFCNFCRVTCGSAMCTILTTGPEILILLLNRGKGIEFNVKINFVNELDLSKYITYANTGYYYKLIGVITHMGESGMGGHFIAYCLEPKDQKWYKYNDSIISKVNDFQNEVINYAMPYLLFYQKIK